MGARCDQPGEMRHIDHEQGTDIIGNSAEAGEIDDARIGGATGDNQLRLMLFGQRLDLIIVDQMVFAAHAILHGVEPFARHRRRRAVGQVTARVQAHAEDGRAGLGQRQHHRAIGLRPRMRLDIGKAAAEQRLRPLDRQRFHRVGRRTALIIAPSRIALGIFVGEYRSLRL